jgi:hypothetical protein
MRKKGCVIDEFRERLGISTKSGRGLPALQDASRTALVYLLLPCGRGNGRGSRVTFADGALSHFGKDEEIEEVHEAEDQQHATDFRAEDFEGFFAVAGCATVFKGQADVANVDQIKTDDQEMIDGIGEPFVPMKAIHKKDPAVFMQSAGDPDREADTDKEVR